MKVLLGVVTMSTLSTLPVNLYLFCALELCVRTDAIPKGQSSPLHVAFIFCMPTQLQGRSELEPPLPYHISIMYIVSIIMIINVESSWNRALILLSRGNFFFFF